MKKYKAATFFPPILLVILGWFVFGQTLHFNFFNYDDYDYLFHTPFLKEPWRLDVLKKIFSYVGTGNWHPLVWISLKLDAQIFGTEAFGYHFTNVCLHVMNALLLFGILKKMTRSVWRSFFVAAFFLVHPQRAESVAWIVERKDVLSGFFFMLTLWAYTNYSRIKNFRWVRFLWYLLTLIVFIFGLLSKSMLVTLPFLMLLLDFWPLQREASFAKRLIEKAPFFIFIAISSYIALLVRAEVSLDINEQVSFMTRFWNSFVFYAIYIREALFPYPLTFYRIYPFEGVPFAWVVVGVLSITLPSFLLIWKYKKFPSLFVGWFWFLGMLFPVIGFVHVGYAAYSDRYTYLPSIGLILFLVWGINLLFEEPKGKQSKILIYTACLLLFVHSFLGWRQTSLWRDSESLYKFSIKHNPENYHIHEALCDYLFDEERIHEAISVCVEVAKNFPERVQASYTLGRIYFGQGRYSEAMEHFLRMIKSAMLQRYRHEIDKDVQVQKKIDEFSQIYRALVMRKKAEHPFYVLGNYWMNNRFHRLAVDAYREALNLSPRSVPVHVNLANVYFIVGKSEQARKHFEIAIQLDGRDVNANYNFGLFLNSQGEEELAKNQYEKTLEIDPSHAGAEKMLRKINN